MPTPLVTAKASPTSIAKLGISEWRVYRGKTDVTLTGYNGSGAAVKGVSVAFGGESSVLKGRVLDGSLFAAKYDFASKQASSNGKIQTNTAAFLKQATLDFRALKTNVPAASAVASTRHDWQPSSSTPLGVSGGCGDSMIGVVTTALDCIRRAAAGGGGDGQAAIAQCVAAAQGASGSGSACSGFTGTFDATSNGTGCYGNDPGDPSGFGSSSGSAGWGDDDDSFGGGGGSWGDDDDDESDCGGMDSGWSGWDDGGWCSDPFGDGGGGFDFSCDSGNGGVGWGAGGGFWGGGGGWGGGY